MSKGQCKPSIFILRMNIEGFYRCFEVFKRSTLIYIASSSKLNESKKLHIFNLFKMVHLRPISCKIEK